MVKNAMMTAVGIIVVIGGLRMYCETSFLCYDSPDLMSKFRRCINQNEVRNHTTYYLVLYTSSKAPLVLSSC